MKDISDIHQAIPREEFNTRFQHSIVWEPPGASPAPSDLDETDRSLSAKDLLYCKDGKRYIWPTKDGRWTWGGDFEAKRFLAAALGITNVREQDKYLFEATHERSVDYMGPLAGYTSGVYTLQGKLVLVESSPIWIDGEKGNWDTIRELLLNMLGKEQFAYFCAWLKAARQSLSEMNHIPGQALVIAGPAGCGKTLTQDQIITPLLGGRKGNPFPFLSGRTPFNAELFGYEHLVVSDQTSHTDYASRRTFGERLKDLVANTWHRCERKYGTPIELDPYWRLSISLNDEPENLQILPSIEDSLADKLMIFRVKKHEMPMRTGTPQARRDFADVLASELPAFAYYLDSAFEIPQDMLDSRYMVRAYHSPLVTEALREMTPEEHLKELIISAISEDLWEGSATDLHRRLMGDGPMAYEARQLLRNPKATGTYLARLSKLYPTAAVRTKSNGVRRWEIRMQELREQGHQGHSGAFA